VNAQEHEESTQEPSTRWGCVPTANVEDPWIRYTLHAVRGGMLSSVFIILVVTLYLFLPGHHDVDRAGAVALVLVATALTVVAGWLPWRAIIAHNRGRIVIYGWAMVMVGIVDLALAVLLGFWADRALGAHPEEAGLAGWRRWPAVAPAVAAGVLCVTAIAIPGPLEQAFGIRSTMQRSRVAYSVRWTEIRSRSSAVSGSFASRNCIASRIRSMLPQIIACTGSSPPSKARSSGTTHSISCRLEATQRGIVRCRVSMSSTTSAPGPVRSNVKISELRNCCSSRQSSRAVATGMLVRCSRSPENVRTTAPLELISTVWASSPMRDNTSHAKLWRLPVANATSIPASAA